MNVIQLAKAIVSQECSFGERAAHLGAGAKSRTKVLVDGELQWIGEYTDPRESRPCKLINGDKQLMTGAEQKLFAKSPYERGMMEYQYEGQLRQVRAGADPKDPRGAYREGQGVLKYAGGELYEGTWRLNKRQGQGYLSTPKGYRYQGEWLEDEPSGKGYEAFTCKCAIDAQFEHGAPDGVGVLLYAPQHNQYRYEGEFHMGRRHGKGTIFYTNGDTFQGVWDCGKRHGRGITTRTVTPVKTIQYETEWDQDVLISGPSLIDKFKRTKKPAGAIPFTTQSLLPADLTKWKVKEDVTELPMEHFLRIKLGFEKLDVNGSGSLSTAELTEIWGNGSQDMLSKLDADGNGTVELDEIFAAWYPNVAPHNVQRFMQLDISPKVLLRLRGYLAGVRDDLDMGYLQVVQIKNIETEEDRPLLIKHLEQSGYKVGGEKFTLAMYESAKVLCDPPHFLEVLETWYPNINRATLQRYLQQDVDADDLEQIKETFYKLSKGEIELNIEQFEAAQDLFRQEGTTYTESSNAIEACMVPGFFKGQPFWQLGSLRLSVKLLQDIDKFDRKIGGGVSLQQLLRFSFPNIKCKRTQELITGRRRPGQCSCTICSVT